MRQRKGETYSAVLLLEKYDLIAVRYSNNEKVMLDFNYKGGEL